MAGVLSTLPDKLQLNESERHLSFLPLAHIFEQLVMCAIVSVGGAIAFYRGDILKLLEDVGEAKPTIFPAVPRLLNRIHSKILGTINEAGGVKKALFYRALQAKQQLLREGVCTKDSIWDRLVFRKVQARLGGRVKLFLSGAAPISPEVLDFFRAAFGCPVMEGYGQTETCAAITLTHGYDYALVPGGHVGPILPCNEVKLVDIPDMGYLATDQPNPRGEVCVRGHNVFKGYYKEPKKTAETIDSDGWCHTGDVGMVLPNGCLKIIDRKKHIFKLAQGEYIAPEKIENIYVKAPLVAQVFAHGDSLKRYAI
jgi:long-chain acyl-CoA synthetase